MPVTKNAAGELVLAKTWNLHPKGSRVVREDDGVTIIDAGE